MAIHGSRAQPNSAPMNFSAALSSALVVGGTEWGRRFHTEAQEKRRFYTGSLESRAGICDGITVGRSKVPNCRVQTAFTED
ncbi:hypothetical protein ABEW05_007619 [Botrytis cinerea]